MAEAIAGFDAREYGNGGKTAAWEWRGPASSGSDSSAFHARDQLQTAPLWTAASSCTHDPCGQKLVWASPRRGVDRGQFQSARSLAIRIVHISASRTAMDRTQAEFSPPKIAAPDPLSAILRI